ncbi:hypothetical protein ACFLU3_03175 [Chloroflexota bacterium]
MTVSSTSADEDYPFVDDKSEGDEDMYDSHVDLDELDDPSEYIIEDDSSVRLDIRTGEIEEIEEKVWNLV